jgi:hypothetical protein
MTGERLRALMRLQDVDSMPWLNSTDLRSHYCRWTSDRFRLRHLLAFMLCAQHASCLSIVTGSTRLDVVSAMCLC